MNISKALILVAVVGLFSCERSPVNAPQKADDSSLAFTPDTDRIQVHPFPEATEVRLYINQQSIDVSPQGEVSEGSYPRGGIPLTTSELHSIQDGLNYKKPPDAIAACCVPRHAFLFYDKAHKFLGSITVCFECGCATIDGQMPKPPANMEWLDWDETRFAHIIEAHGQTVHFGD